MHTLSLAVARNWDLVSPASYRCEGITCMVAVAKVAYVAERREKRGQLRITRGMLPRCTAATCINSTTDSPRKR